MVENEIDLKLRMWTVLRVNYTMDTRIGTIASDVRKLLPEHLVISSSDRQSYLLILHNKKDREKITKEVLKTRPVSIHLYSVVLHLQGWNSRYPNCMREYFNDKNAGLRTQFKRLYTQARSDVV
jgi:hypothetical protein